MLRRPWTSTDFHHGVATGSRTGVHGRSHGEEGGNGSTAAVTQIASKRARVSPLIAVGGFDSKCCPGRPESRRAQRGGGQFLYISRLRTVEGPLAQAGDQEAAAALPDFQHSITLAQIQRLTVRTCDHGFIIFCPKPRGSSMSA